MDILFVAHCPPYPPRFDERGLIYYLAREYSRRRRLIDLIYFYDQPEQIADVPRYSHFFREVKPVPSQLLTSSQLQQRLKRNGVRFPTRVEEAWSKEMWKAVEQFISRKPYLITYVFGSMNIYEYHHLLQNYPTILIPLHAPANMLPMQIASTRSRSERRQLQQIFHVLKAYESWMYRPFDRIVVSTEPDAHTLNKADSGLDVRVIPTGVDVDYFIPTGYPPPIPALLFIGDYARKSDLDAALQLCKHIYPGVKRNHPSLELYIVGDNPPPELRKYASEQIHVTGHVLDVRPFFELASVYVSPIVRQAGINKHILQAMAMVTPVVATPQSLEGLKLVHEQHALICDSMDELTRAVQRLLQSQQLYQKLQHEGRDLVNQHYTWQHIADRYQALQEELL